MSKVNISPFRNYVMLSPIEPVKTTPGGLIIPEAHQKKVAPQGKVLEKGPECCNDAIKEGDIVFFPMHSEARAEFGGQSYIFITEDQLIGCIKEV